MHHLFSQPKTQRRPLAISDTVHTIHPDTVFTLSVSTRRDCTMNTIITPETDRLPDTCFPESMREIIRVLGYDSAVRLAEAFGGSTLSGKKGTARERSGGVHRLLESVLTRDEITRLIAWAGGAELYIPRCDSVTRARRNARFIGEFNQMTGAGLSARVAMATLCPRYGFSDRHGWEVVKRWRESNAHNRG